VIVHDDTLYMLITTYLDGLPEWSTINTDDIDNIGTFDSSGAFMSVKVCHLVCVALNVKLKKIVLSS